MTRMWSSIARQWHAAMGRDSQAIRFGASVLTGCLFFLSCPDFDLWPLAWIAFIPLLWAIRGAHPRHAFIWGWIAGIVTNLGGFYWITHLLVRFGQMPMVVSVPLFLLLAAYQGLHWGAFAYLLRKLDGRFPTVLLAPVLMTALELLMPAIFDWYIAISQAWVLPVIQIAELTGPLGVTFWVLLVNGMLYALLEALHDKRPLPRRSLAIGTAFVIAAMIFGVVRIHQIGARRAEAPKIKAGIVQGNFGIVSRARASVSAATHRTYLQHSRRLQQQGAELLVWPESAYPFAIERNRTSDFAAHDMRQVMRGLDVPLIFGALSFSRDERYPYNTAFMMQPDGRIAGRYDKNFPLIFGEYIPFYEYIPQFKQWFPAASHFARGTTVTTFPFREYRLGPSICYEDIIPSFNRKLAQLRPHLLVNITNDAWFGLSSEPYEHLALAVYRSVELRLDMVRAVNTGISALIDATGRVVAQTKSYDPTRTPGGVPPVTLLTEPALMPTNGTVYTAVGDLFGYLNLAAAVSLLLFVRGGRGTSLLRRRGKRRS